MIMRPFPHILFLLFFVNLACTKAQTTQLDSTEIEVAVVAEDLHVPWELVWGPNDFLWFTERNGRVKRLNPESGSTTTLLTIPEVFEVSESGLLGMALDPEFNTSPFVYLVYTYISGNGLTERVVRYTFTGSELTGEEILLDNIPANNNHSGSRLLFLPDQTLIMTTGDALNTSNSQDLQSLAGKVLRMTKTGDIPQDNPIPGSYIYSFGHRNAQGLVLGPNNKIYSSEHGPNSDDELNVIIPNRNFGWPNVKGFCDENGEQNFCNTNNVVEPIAAWTPTLAVAGITYYNHNNIPEWKNAILMCTLKEDDLRVINLNEDGSVVTDQSIHFNNQFGRLRAICTAPNGDIYLASSNRDGRANGGFPLAEDDRIFRLRANTQTGLLENSQQSNPLFLPNPVSDALAIRRTHVAQVDIYNSNAQLIHKSDKSKLDLKGIPSGMYFITVQSEAGLERARFVKQ